MSTSEDVPLMYIWGYHEYIRDIMRTSGDVQYSGGIS